MPTRFEKRRQPNCEIRAGAHIGNARGREACARQLGFDFGGDGRGIAARERRGVCQPAIRA
jgi:hypothetical protein